MNWKNAVTVNAAPAAPIAVEALGPTPAQLIAAGVAFDARRDNFALGKGAICRDIAARITGRGYASDKQRDFAGKLVEWSKPRVAAPAAPAAPGAAPVAYTRPANTLPVPKLFAVMQKHATLHAGDMKISRKNQDTMCWVIWKNVASGKLADGTATVWASKFSDGPAAALALLAEFELDPLAAAVKYGRLSGRCCSCGRDLTDPASIAAGIGPICATKF